MNTPVRSLRIPDELWDWLKRRADGLDTNRSHIVVTTLSEMARNDISPERLHQLIQAAAVEDENE